jgi:hypothetical protein
MIILASKGGALGNRLWSFAHLIATAEEHGFRVADVAFDEFGADFVGTYGNWSGRYPAPRRSSRRTMRRLRRWLYEAVRVLAAVLARLPVVPWPFVLFRIDWNERCDMGSEAFAALVRRRPLVVLQGWFFRDEDSLRRHADVVRQFFRPTPLLEASVERFLVSVRAADTVLLGVHVRQGDYSWFREGRYYYELATYRQAIVRFAALVPDLRVRVVLCSDQVHDPAQLAVPGVEVVPGPGTPLEDMHALAGCDYLIAPPSTFTLWASFAGEVPLLLLESADQTFALSDFGLLDTAFRNGEDVAVPVQPPSP